MKKLVFTIAVIGSSFICSPMFSQGQIKDSLGLPGDNLNLYGVLDIFQQSKTLEEFENKLNAQDSKLNNLDLNNDNKIDYIKVVDNVQGTSHAIALKDEISEKEMQDVAVIEVDKDKDGKVKVQIVGDELLYGKNYIVEPKELAQKDASGNTPNPGYTGGNQPAVINNTTNNYYDNDNYSPHAYYGGGVYYPVNSWFMWDFLFAPAYVVYVSPWHWGYYPHYWNPWTPFYWHEYYGFHYHMYGYYQRAYEFRAPGAHGFYGPRRSVAVTVNQRAASGTYNNTYGRRDLLNKSMSENKAIRANSNQNQNRGNNNVKQNDIRQRNENGINEHQQRNNEPQNNVRENKQERNNNQQVQPNRSERREMRQQQRMQQRSQPRSQPRNNSGGGARPGGGGGGGRPAGGGGHPAGGRKGR